MKALRAQERTGRPLGDEDFLALLEQNLGRILRRQKPGPKDVKVCRRADAAGRLDLRIHARGPAAGIGLHVVGAGLLALAWMVRDRQEQSGFVP